MEFLRQAEAQGHPKCKLFWWYWMRNKNNKQGNPCWGYSKCERRKRTPPVKDEGLSLPKGRPEARFEGWVKRRNLVDSYLIIFRLYPVYILTCIIWRGKEMSEHKAYLSCAFDSMLQLLVYLSASVCLLTLTWWSLWESERNSGRKMGVKTTASLSTAFLLQTQNFRKDQNLKIQGGLLRPLRAKSWLKLHLSNLEKQY